MIGDCTERDECKCLHSDSSGKGVQRKTCSVDFSTEEVNDAWIVIAL